MKHCEKCKEFMLFEHDLIVKHIQQHKWFRGISNIDDAIYNFIESYAWIIRESFCGSCSNRLGCDIYTNKSKQSAPIFMELIKNINKLSESELNEILICVNEKVKNK